MKGRLHLFSTSFPWENDDRSNMHGTESLIFLSFRCFSFAKLGPLLGTSETRSSKNERTERRLTPPDSRRPTRRPTRTTPAGRPSRGDIMPSSERRQVYYRYWKKNRRKKNKRCQQVFYGLFGFRKSMSVPAHVSGCQCMQPFLLPTVDDSKYSITVYSIVLT